MSEKPPQEFDELNALIADEYHGLSKRLRQIADFGFEQPTTMALETIANIAKSAGVQPSALIRFAQALGFSGFRELQRIYQRHVAHQSASYKERINRELTAKELASPESPLSLLKQLCKANIVALQQLPEVVTAKDLEKSVNLITRAEQVYIMAQRRSFPVATYFAYSLSHVDCRIYLLGGYGGLLAEQARSMTKKDVLIAISFHPYSRDTVKIVSTARDKKIPFIAISDSSVSPIVKGSIVSFNMHDAEVHSIRSLTSSLSLAQSIATSIAFKGSQSTRKRKVQRK